MKNTNDTANDWNTVDGINNIEFYGKELLLNSENNLLGLLRKIFKNDDVILALVAKGFKIPFSVGDILYDNEKIYEYRDIIIYDELDVSTRKEIVILFDLKEKINVAIPMNKVNISNEFQKGMYKFIGGFYM